jgi:hypothetical protein
MSLSFSMPLHLSFMAFIISHVIYHSLMSLNRFLGSLYHSLLSHKIPPYSTIIYSVLLAVETICITFQWFFFPLLQIVFFREYHLHLPW